MIPGETITSGGERVCPDCNVDALMRLTADEAVRTFCLCGPFSRESIYSTHSLCSAVVQEARRRFKTAPETEWPFVLLEVLQTAGIAR